MTQQIPPPSLSKINQRVAQVQEICQRADAGILILDELIVQLEQNIHSSSFSQYRLDKEKHLRSA
ncbi:MAG: hypothetical protein HC940_11575 [Acaryochloris sp. SU_5_25]|nr:hypothetical protein [Acaryochloris sp. SU_5_25]